MFVYGEWRNDSVSEWHFYSQQRFVPVNEFGSFICFLSTVVSQQEAKCLLLDTWMFLHANMLRQFWKMERKMYIIGKEYMYPYNMLTFVVTSLSIFLGFCAVELSRLIYVCTLSISYYALGGKVHCTSNEWIDNDVSDFWKCLIFRDIFFS